MLDMLLRLFDEMLAERVSAADARAEMATLGLPGALVNGFAHRRAGMEALSV